MIKNKRLLFFPLLFIFLFVIAPSIFAIEVPLPGLCSGSGPCNPSLPEYVAYIFKVIVSIAGVLALISFVVGAVGLINPNIEAHADAKDRMKGAILGLVLVVVSFVILQTINPKLTTITSTPLAPGAGIYYTDGQKRAAVGMGEPSVANRPQDISSYNNLIYDCAGGTGPALFIWEYPQANYMGNNNYEGVQVKRITCGQSETIGGLGSFQLAFETPGVYYCTGGGGGAGTVCDGYMSSAHTSDDQHIEYPFAGNIKKVVIIDGPGDAPPYYGVIFHEVEGLANGGDCTSPIINSGGTTVDNFDAAAADIFQFNKGYNGYSSGDGVSFYSEPYGWDTAQEAGYYDVSDQEIKTLSAASPYYWVMASDKMSFSYTKVPRPKSYQDKYKTFQDSPGSINISGSYLVGLYSRNPSASNPEALYCQTFNQSNNDLGAEPIIASGRDNKDFVNVLIIPTQ